MSNESESRQEERVRNSTLEPWKGTKKKRLIETELSEDLALWLFFFCAQKSFNNYKMNVVFVLIITASKVLFETKI